METVIINTKNVSSAKFILELVQKLGESGKILNVEEKEDFFLGTLMNVERTNKKVSREAIIKKLRK